MRILTIGLISCLGAYYASAALADEPKSQSSTPAQSAQAPAATAPACTPTASAPCKEPTPYATIATAKPATPSVGVDDATDKVLRSRGYKVEVRNGNTFYCRRETVVGSHFESKVCGTAEQMHSSEQDTQDTVDKIARQQAGPVSK